MEAVLPVRRRSYGSIRSPNVKRDNQSLVVIKGWLFKLEGGALKQWKRRWCVLTDYCLFFYKSPDEDKVFSTVVLPSCKISPCSNEDRISKKFAFKVEHQNMKTYFFAAENKDSMKQWMNAMSLTSIMQNLGKNEKVESGISSTSHDEDDSGFTSYRSRRCYEQDPNITFDSSHGSEGIKHRSRSCSERVNETYLNSDDKYPTFPSHSQQYYTNVSLKQDVPRRQPLYANAPPKPRRLTQSEPFAIAPNEQYDDMRYVPPNHEQYQYPYQRPPEVFNYPGYPPMMYADTVVELDPNSYNVYRQETSFQEAIPYSNSYPSRNHTSDLHELAYSYERPQRPHSADFLERETESISPSTKECRTQPKRPKSSLEYYDKYWETEEGNAYNYQESVPIAQGDDMYISKNDYLQSEMQPYDPSFRNLNQDVNPPIHYDPKVVIPSHDYIRHNNYIVQEQSYQPAEFSEPTSNLHVKKKKTHEESMRRLMEWKQRMLQSPLTRRAAQYSSSSSDAGSPRRPPTRPPLPSQYQAQVLQDLAAHEARLLQKSPHFHSDRNQQSSNSPSRHQYYRPETELARGHSSDYLPSLQQNNRDPSDLLINNNTISNEKMSHEEKKDKIKKSNSSMDQQNILYCVDSDNNELLIYGDNYVEVPNANEEPYYTEKRSSADGSPGSVMNSVMNKPNRNVTSSSQIEHVESSSNLAYHRHQSHVPSKEHSPKAVSVQQLPTSYSSDDEDNDDQKLKRAAGRVTKIQTATIVEIHEPRSEAKMSPDYVNISIMNQKPNVQYPIEEKQDYENSKRKHPHPVYMIDQFENQSLSRKDRSSEKIFKEIDGGNKKKDLYMDRDDYHRACQMFFSSPNRNSSFSSLPFKTSSCTSPEKSPSYSGSPLIQKDHDKSKSIEFKAPEVLDLDKDVGLPLPPVMPLKQKNISEKPDRSSQVQDNFCSSTTVRLNASDNEEKLPNTISENLYSHSAVHESEVDCSKESSSNQKAIFSTNSLEKPFDHSGSKKHVSFEELRMQLQRQREAPPPNIVQERIKKFECVETKILNCKDNASLPAENKTASKESIGNKFPPPKGDKISKRKFKHKVTQSSKISNSRCLHSDTEAIVVQESVDSCSDDDMTMKSAPILLSPLSSVLADLRKTADSGKETKAKVSHTENVEKFSPRENRYQLFNTTSSVNVQTLSPDEKKKYELDEEAYLPMDGLRNTKEPEYVAMEDNPLKTSVPKPTKVPMPEEPVYNEPFSPPQSFLHDVYGKQKGRNIQFETDTSSSDESSSEHIYEKPRHAIAASEPSLYKGTSHRTSKQEFKVQSLNQSGFSNRNKSKIFLSNSMSAEQIPINISVPGDYSSFCQSAEMLCSSNQHNVQTHLNHSVPDLLQLQDIKDSEASDADDEASRDFDTSVNLQLPSYQSEIFEQQEANVESLSCVRYDGHSSFDSEIMSFTFDQECIPKARDPKQPTFSSNQSNNSISAYYGKTEDADKSVSNPSHFHADGTVDIKPKVKEAFHCGPEEGKKIHLRKLKIYAKGKKPESPKLHSVPFNLEVTSMAKETQMGNVTEYSATDHHIPLNIDCYSQPASTSLPQHISFVPDVVPAECVDEKADSIKDSSLSRSPNSAPYYYSDLLPEGHVLNATDLAKRSECVEIQKYVLPKPSQVMLNNIMCKSPTYISKGDIGRKVNKISTKTLPPDEKSVINNCSKTVTKNEVPITVANLKHSLDSFYASESKYLDAERNKYEAGHTLEKTRRMNSALTYFKQRASTPDLKTGNYQTEPVYENLTLKKTPLHKRLSCSLEAISKPEYAGNNPETDIYATVEDLRRVDSPVYENLEFFQHRGETEFVKEPASLSPSYQILVPQTTYMEPNTTAMQCKLENVNYKNQCDKLPIPNPHFHHQDSCENFDTDNNYLNQNELRRVSQQYFLGHFNKEKIFSKSKSNCSPIQSQPIHDVDQYDRKGNNVGSYYHPCQNTMVIENVASHDQNVNNKVADYKTDKISPSYDSDDNSSSYSSSSYEEASVDVEYSRRQKNSRNKVSLNQVKNVSDSEIQVREPCQLKKLVQLSEGVMNKGKRLSVSAGDLLGKTHEELVLLLIQLRRNQARIVRAKEKCMQQLENVQQFSTMNECMKQMYSQNFGELMQQVTLLEKQFESTRPLINLVDNMVKLGSLYGSSDKRSSSYPHLESTHFSKPPDKTLYVNMPLESQVWSSTEENDLQGHLNEMCHLDKGISRETHSYTSLQQDKEMLEHTLHGMRNKILDHQDKPIELQKLRKQQRMIEKELTRVKRLLNHSAKKIEDATTKNDQLEQEILLLRQRLQQVLKTGSSELKSSQARADLEAELTRVQNVLEELANHRQEISNAVETLKNDNQPRMSLCSSKVRASPTGVAGSAPLPLRRKQQSTYFETDLDTMKTCDLSTIGRDMEDIPVYANADELNNPTQDHTIHERSSRQESDKVGSSSNSDKENVSQCPMQDINEADDKMKRFYGILPREKPCEIKTVRIVKRQSERRSRERDKKRVTYGDESSVWVMDEPEFSSDDHLETDEETYKKITSSFNYVRPTSILLPSGNFQRQSGSLSAHERLFGSSTTVQTDDGSKASNNSKISKRSKRRHYTVSGCQYLSDPQFSQISREKPRSRDDVDMERCLRTANTPDIVRSTIKKKEVYDEKIIERELGLPQKIKIPERYIEDEPERLSASEKLRRSRKAENIRKMLSETTATYENVAESTCGPPEKLHEKCTEQKRKRAHLLALNHALAQEVMQRSKAVAVLATFERLAKDDKPSPIEDLSPMVELPITQQRYNMLC